MGLHAAGGRPALREQYAGRDLRPGRESTIRVDRQERPRRTHESSAGPIGWAVVHPYVSESVLHRGAAGRDAECPWSQTMKQGPSRREFLKQSTVAAAIVAAPTALDKLR